MHFRKPGLEHRGRIRNGSCAAVAGGITPHMGMQNTRSPTLDAERLREKLSIAACDSVANYAFYLGASPENIGEIVRADPASIAGVKVFMGGALRDACGLPANGGRYSNLKPLIQKNLVDSPTRIV